MIRIFSWYQACVRGGTGFLNCGGFFANRWIACGGVNITYICLFNLNGMCFEGLSSTLYGSFVPKPVSLFLRSLEVFLCDIFDHVLLVSNDVYFKIFLVGY